MSTRKLVIDTDPGIDDAMAIVFACLHPDLDLIGLTTVFGNVSTDVATRNALWLAELSRQDIPVARGEAAPIVQETRPFAREFHGDDGFGHLPPRAPRGRPASGSAAEFLAEAARAHPGELEICAVGPLTNVAAALGSSPEFQELVKSVTIMGGSLDAGGNVTEFAEANIWQDPHAAEIVFSANLDVTIVGLDVTGKVICTREDFAELGRSAPVLGGFLNDAAQYYFESTLKRNGIRGCHMHDPTAVIRILRPDLFTTQSSRVGVVCSGPRAGETVWMDGPPERPPVCVCTGVSAEDVRQLFLETVRSGF